MKQIVNHNTVEENLNKLDALIDGLINDLRRDRNKNQKKIIETCHVGKFLMLTNYDCSIESSEKPDFIVNIGTIRIGLEHQIIVNQEIKEFEGFFENVFALAEAELTQENEVANFLANCYLKHHLTYKMSDKTELVKIVKKVVKHHILNGGILQNKIIEDIFSMPHDRITLSPNIGVWWQKEITPEVILNAVKQKDEKCDSYIKNTQLNQWLLLVIGGLKGSSYEVKKQFDMSLYTKFEKIFLLEDFRNRVFQLK